MKRRITKLEISKLYKLDKINESGYISLFNNYKNKKKKFFFFFNCYNKKFKNLFILIFHISGFGFYLLSLTHIEGLEMKCFSYIGIQCYYFLAKLTFISGLIVGLTLYTILYHNYSKIHFFIIFFIYLLLYKIDNHKDIEKHGFYNFIGFLSIIIILFILLNIIHLLIILYKKKAYLFLLFFAIQILFFFS